MSFKRHCQRLSVNNLVDIYRGQLRSLEEVTERRQSGMKIRLWLIYELPFGQMRWQKWANFSAKYMFLKHSNSEGDREST